MGTRGTPFYGRARLRIPTTTVEADSIQAVGAKQGFCPQGTLNRYDVATCDFLPMERTGAPATVITLATVCGSATISRPLGVARSAHRLAPACH